MKRHETPATNTQRVIGIICLSSYSLRSHIIHFHGAFPTLRASTMTLTSGSDHHVAAVAAAVTIQMERCPLIYTT